MKKFETFFILCSTENNGETGQGIYTGDSGEGENDTTDVEQTDPLAEADSALEEDKNKGGESSSESTNQENNSTEGAVPIDPVECVAEGNSNPEEEEIVDDPNWGMEDTQDEQEETNPEEEELIQNAEEDGVDESKIEQYAKTYTFVSLSSSMTMYEQQAFYEAYSKLPSTLQTIEVLIKIDNSLEAAGKYDRGGIITFRDVKSIQDSITEEFVHAYQDCIMGWNSMSDSRAEIEFEAKMIITMNEYIETGLVVGVLSGVGLSIYEFFADCMGDDVCNPNVESYSWDIFNAEVFKDRASSFFESWRDLDTEYSDLPVNEDYEWNFWDDLIAIYKTN